MWLKSTLLLALLIAVVVQGWWLQTIFVDTGGPEQPFAHDDNVNNAWDNYHGKYIKQGPESRFGLVYCFSVRGMPIQVYEARYEKAGGIIPFYSAELERSVQSLRRTNAGISTTLLVGDREHEALNSTLLSLFDNIIRLPENIRPTVEWGDKVLARATTPYERTLFLDLDTTVCEDISFMFDILDECDFALSMETLSRDDYQLSWFGKKDLSRDVKLFSYMNSGVQLYRKNKAVWNFFKIHNDIHSERGGSDQYYMGLYGYPGQTLERAGVRVLQLPAEYNFRSNAGKAPSLLTGSVKIVHSRSARCEIVNVVRSPRLFDHYKNQVTFVFNATDKTNILPIAYLGS